MGTFREIAGALVWSEGRHYVEIRGLGNDAIRVRATVNREFAEVPQAIIDPDSSPEDAARLSTAVPNIHIEDDGAEITNGAIRATVTSYGRIRFVRTTDGALLLEDVDWRPDHPPLLPQSRSFASLESDLYRIEARFNAQHGERFYGLGQHRHGLLDQKGAVVELFQRNAEVSIPFLVSSRQYGFLWNNPAVGRVELGSNGTRWVADASRQLDYVVIAGDDYADILSKYVDITGHAPMLPEWASGFWQCKLRYTTQEELLSVAREYHKRRLPLSVIVVDYFHWTRQGDWDWDPECWPDPAGMIRELDAMGVKLMVSIWPSVNGRSDNAAVMKDSGYLVGTNHGPDVIFRFVDTYEPPPVYVHFYDSTNPAARQFVWNTVKKSYWDIGVKLFWLDACEPEINPVEHANLRFHAGTGSEVANIYPMLHERGFYDGMKATGTDEIVNLCRSGWAGSQRYGAAIWSGDISSDWETFRAQIRAGLNIMMSGIPWWTTDIGGFFGGNIEDPGFRELLVRWFQYGAFCPLFRLHGNREPKEQHVSGVSGADNEVWSFGDENYTIIKSILEMRERMRPYIMKQMKLASERGLPPMRPLFFDFPTEEPLYAIEDEFLFGPDIVVAPVVEAGARAREVYLPAGATWYDAWSGRKVESGKWFSADAALETIPVYLKEGASIDLRGRS